MSTKKLTVVQAHDRAGIIPCVAGAQGLAPGGAGRQVQGVAAALPGPLTRLASDHAEQRSWSAPASSFARAPTATSLVAYNPRRAASACTASLFMSARNSCD